MESSESISSMKITEGYALNPRVTPTALNSATPNSARTIFSPSPIYAHTRRPPAPTCW